MTILGAFASYLLFQCPGGLFTSPTAINNAGVITGYCGAQGFIRHPNGAISLFTVGLPTAINAQGDIAGHYDTGNLEPYSNTRIYNGFVRHTNGTVETFSSPGGPNFPTYVNGINANGIVVGDWVDGFNHPMGFVRNPDGTFANLYLYKTTPYAINDANEFAGSWYDVGDKPHGFTMHITDQSYTDVPTDSLNQQLVTAINSAGNVVGSQTTYTTPFQSQAFLTTPKLTFFPSMLPIALQLYYDTFPKTKLAYGGGINTHGYAVFEDQYRAPDGTITTINLGPCTNILAQGINDAGQVTGSCTINNQSYGFIWREKQWKQQITPSIQSRIGQ